MAGFRVEELNKEARTYFTSIHDSKAGPIPGSDNRLTAVTVSRDQAEMMFKRMADWPQVVMLPELMGFPDGAKIVSVEWDHCLRAFTILMSHPSFPVTPDGQRPPYVQAGQIRCHHLQRMTGGVYGDPRFVQSMHTLLDDLVRMHWVLEDAYRNYYDEASPRQVLARDIATSIERITKKFTEATGVELPDPPPTEPEPEEIQDGTPQERTPSETAPPSPGEDSGPGLQAGDDGGGAIGSDPSGSE